MGSAMKLMREIGLVSLKKDVKDAVDSQKADMIFAAVKGPSQKKLDFKHFIDFAYIICTLKELKIEVSPANKAIGGDDDSYATLKGKNSDGEICVSKPFYYYRLAGRPAMICYFIDTYLVKAAKFKTIRSEVATEGGSAAMKRAEKTVDTAVRSMQAFFMRQIMRNRRNKRMNLKAGEGFAVKQFLAVSKIQMTFRRHHARNKLIRTAQHVYVKYLDQEGIMFWRHRYTKESHYTKPFSLRNFDCGVPVQYPAEDESCVIDCCVCVGEADRPALLLCMDCDKPYCEECFAVGHKGGNRRNHVPVNYAMCVQCEFQVQYALKTSWVRFLLMSRPFVIDT